MLLIIKRMLKDARIFDSLQCVSPWLLCKNKFQNKKRFLKMIGQIISCHLADDGIFETGVETE